MATSTASSTGAGAGHGTTPGEASSRSQPQSNIAVEMSDLEASKRTGASAGTQGRLNDVTNPSDSLLPSASATTSTMSKSGEENTKPERLSNVAVSASQPAAEPFSSSSNDPEIAASSTSASGPASASPAPHPPSITRLDSVAIGPAIEASPPAVVNEAGPVLVITLLLTSGARHPYKIDEKYLTKRNVNVTGVTEGGKKDPYSISVYTLKELILREWREEWEAQPSSPSSIRLIYFGRLLDDKTPLKGMLSRASLKELML